MWNFAQILMWIIVIILAITIYCWVFGTPCDIESWWCNDKKNGPWTGCPYTVTH